MHLSHYNDRNTYLCKSTVIPNTSIIFLHGLLNKATHFWFITPSFCVIQSHFILLGVPPKALNIQWMKTTNFSNYKVSKATLGKSNKDFFFRTTNVTKGLQSLADVAFLVFT